MTDKEIRYAEKLERHEREATQFKEPSISWVFIAIVAYFVLGSLV